MAEKKIKGHRWFAAIYDLLMAANERSFMKDARHEIAGGAKGQTLEIGCGTGANLSYYSDNIKRIVATDPDPYMLDRAQNRAVELGKPIELNQAPAEELPFADHSFDTVVSTLVMCTVRDPQKVLSEVRRVLKPEGEFRFYEHVRYDHAFGAFWQDLITPVWRWFGAGCHPNRDLERLIRDAGFNILEMEHLKPLPPIPPMAFSRPHIKGIATPA